MKQAVDFSPKKDLFENHQLVQTYDEAHCSPPTTNSTRLLSVLTKTDTMDLYMFNLEGAANVDEHLAEGSSQLVQTTQSHTVKCSKMTSGLQTQYTLIKRQ